MEQKDFIAWFVSAAGCLGVLASIAGVILGLCFLDLLILVDLFKKRTVSLWLTLIALSFGLAFAFERMGQHHAFWFCTFFLVLFSVPIYGFYKLNKAGRIHTKSENRLGRIFEGSIIACVIPCVIGLWIVMAGFSMMDYEIHRMETDPHGLTQGNWARAD